MRREVEAWKVRPRRGEQKRSSKVSGSAAGKVIRIPQPCESQQLVTDPGSRQIALLRRRYLPYAVTSSQSGGEHLATGPFTLSRVLLFSKNPETGRSPPSPPVVSSLHREIFSTRVYKYSQGWRSRLILDRGRTRGRRARGKKQRGSRSPCKKNQLSRDERRI